VGVGVSNEVVVKMKKGEQLGVIWSDGEEAAILLAFDGSPSSKAGLRDYLGRRISHVNGEPVYSKKQAMDRTIAALKEEPVAKGPERDTRRVAFAFANEDAWPASLDQEQRSLLLETGKTHIITVTQWTKVCTAAGISFSRLGAIEVYKVMKYAKERGWNPPPPEAYDPLA